MRVGDDGVIPAARYVSKAFLDLEMERLWPRVWQVACRQEEIPAPGDFVEYTIGDQSILVVRTEGGEISAFYNSCLHRGTRLAEDCGTFEGGQIRCRYHGWRYLLDGRVCHVVDAEDFGSLPTGMRLDPVRAECWGGFVFINMDFNAEPLVEFLEPLPSLLAPYRLDQLKLRSYRSTVLPANWKAVVDAFNEGYHVQGLHPQLLPWTDDVSMAYEQFATHAHYGRLPTARRELRPSPRLGLEEHDIDEGEILASLVTGLAGFFYDEERRLVDELRAAPAPPGRGLLEVYQERRRDLLRSRGVDVSGFSLDQLTSADDVYWFPNLVGPIYPGSAILFRMRPNGLDPDSTIKDIWVLQSPDPDRPEAACRRRFYPDWREKDWGLISNQDYANLANVQAGMKSRSHRGLRVNPRQEGNILHMHRVIDRYLGS
jgi:phenylpropionate dioxygenase-like ring-hydroxylating dioxygenase large terminal subunit